MNHKLFQDSDGNESSKRFIALLLTGVLVLTIILILALSSFNIELTNSNLIEKILIGVMVLIGSIAVGGTAAEQIKNLRKKLKCK